MSKSLKDIYDIQKQITGYRIADFTKPIIVYRQVCCDSCGIIWIERGQWYTEDIIVYNYCSECKS